MFLSHIMYHSPPFKIMKVQAGKPKGCLTVAQIRVNFFTSILSKLLNEELQIKPFTFLKSFAIILRCVVYISSFLFLQVRILYYLSHRALQTSRDVMDTCLKIHTNNQRVNSEILPNKMIE